MTRSKASHHQHAWSDITGKPSLYTKSEVYNKAEADSKFALRGTSYDKSSVDAKFNALQMFSGSYNDLTDKPTIPTKASQVGALPTGYSYSKGEADGRYLRSGEDATLGDTVKVQASTSEDAQLEIAGGTNHNSELELNEAAGQHGIRLLYEGKSRNYGYLQGKDSGKYVTMMEFPRDGAFVNFTTSLRVHGQEVYTSSHKPSASDIGALPANGTAKDSEKLGGRPSSEKPLGASIVKRTSTGDVVSRLFRSEHYTQSAIDEATAGICFRNDTGDDNYMRFVNRSGFIKWLGRVNDSTRLSGKTLDQVKAEARSGLVTTSRTINGVPLRTNISLTKGHIGLSKVANFGYSNSYAGTSTSTYATQKAVYDAAAAPRLNKYQKVMVTSGTSKPSNSQGSDGDVYIQYK